MCTPAVEAISKCAANLGEYGTLGIGALLKEYESARESVAALIGARPDDVSMMQTCAAAISQVALGIDLESGDEIVRFDQEYPSNAYPWHVAAERAGARVIVVPSEADLHISTEKLIDCIGPRTRVVAVSWVQYSTGAVADLAAISKRCQESGAWLVVDAIQGLGVIPFNMSELGVDIVCGGTHKWLCGPLGHGFLVMSESKRKAIQPLLHGAITYGTPDDLVDPKKMPRTDPSRFEPGTPLLLGAVGCAAAIDHLLEAGIKKIHREAMRLANRLREDIQATGGTVVSPNGNHSSESAQSPITTFRPPGETHFLVSELKKERVAFAERGGGIRLSPHALNTDADLEVIHRILRRSIQG